MATRTVGDREIDVSSEEKQLWPDDGVTKGDLVDHWLAVAEHVVPWIEGRPVTMVRCPDDVGDCWYQKRAGDGLPDWVRTATLAGWEDDDVEHVVVDEPATLAALGQLAVVELHVGTSPVDDLDHPVELVVDLDPPERRDAEVRAAARRVRALLEDELGLPTLLKSSGSKGFHVHVPLTGEDDVDAVRGLARDACALLAARHPDDLTVEQRKDQRDGRIFLDWLRNHTTQTAVAPYSPRRLPGAPVATPMDWDELDGTAPDRWSISAVARRLAQRGDPWGGARRTSLGGAVDRLAELHDEAGVG